MPKIPFRHEPFWAAEHPENAPTFEKIRDRVRMLFSRREAPPTEGERQLRLSPHERDLIERCIESAERLHSAGRPVEALGYLYLPLEILSFHEGVDTAEFVVAEWLAKKLVAQETGRRGGKSKAEAARIAEDLIAANLLKMHRKTPFTHQSDMLRAAIEQGPNMGEEGSDAEWAKRLLKRPDLAEIYKALAKSRAPQVNRVTR